jgi:lipopolysaccharide/colanic/teichoic acid biosynthesis glycosyltransferase
MRLAEARSQRLARSGVGTGRRVFDVALAAAGLSALTPLMLVIALAIWVESGRPIFFSQVRLGQHGRHFRLHKFRKFRQIDPVGSLGVTVQDDDRMTRVGRLLAWTKLDELPQFLNIMTGDMSIVGPRPESLAFADCFGERYRAVLDFRPGIFGPNQVFFRSECSLYPGDTDPEAFYRDVLFPLKARADLAYFPRRTARRDLAWIVRGVCAVLGFRFPRKQVPDLVAAVDAWIRQNAGVKQGGA